MTRLARPALILALATVLVAPAVAGDDRTDPPPALPDRTTAEGKNPSGTKPPAANDHVFVLNEAAALDGPVRFKADGELVIEIPVTRYAGPTDNSGNLSNAAALVQGEFLGKYAELRICAYDVDYSGSTRWGRNEEQDRVSFNGFDHLEGDEFATSHLYGLENKWHVKTFYVPIEKVKFPSAAGTGGNAPTAVVNTIKIKLDVKSDAPGKWCTAIDWVALKIEVMSPIILVHGMDDGTEGAGGLIFTAPGTDTTWTTRGQNYTSHLDAKKLVWSNEVDLTPLVAPGMSRAANGKKLSTQLPAIAKQFGADSIHIVAHSKGGLDTRDFLENLHDPKKLQIVSFATLSTPHDGSVLADVLVARHSAAVDKATFTGLPADAEAVAEEVKLNGAHPDLQQTSCVAFATTNVPAIKKKLPDIDKAILFSVAADMNINGGTPPVIDNNPDEYLELRNEAKKLRDLYAATFYGGLGPQGPERARRAVNAVYQTLGMVAGVTVVRGFTPTSIPFRSGTAWVTITATATAAFEGNDQLVTIKSGHGKAGTGAWWGLGGWTQTFSGASGKNHASVVGPASAEWVVPKQKDAERAIGDLK